MIKRIKAACRTNQPQAGMVVLMAIFTLASLQKAGGGSLSLNDFLLGILIWPFLAFIANLIAPLPGD